MQVDCFEGLKGRIGGGNRITLGGDVINNDADLQTINMAMILSANRTFNAASGNIAVGGMISGASFGIIKTGGSNLTLNVSNTYTGTTDVQVGTLVLGANDIFDNASSIKTTAGTVSLSAANTYTGATTIKAGTLELLVGGSLASPSIIVGDAGSTGAILDELTTLMIVKNGQTVSGIGTIKGSTTIQSGGTLAPGNSAVILTNLGNITLDSGSSFAVEIGGVTAGIGAYDVVLMAVPEPAAGVFGGIGVLFLLRRRRGAC